jgi:glucose dehydrogenase
MNKHSMCIGILILLLALCLLAPARFALAQTSLDWPFYGHDLANTRYQNVDQINPSNVANLKVAWIFHTGVLDPKAELEVSPIEVNGTVYITDGHDDVFAVDAVTGSQKWAYMPITIAGEMPPLTSISVCCGRNNRGVVFVPDMGSGAGAVIYGRLDDVVVAWTRRRAQSCGRPRLPTSRIVWPSTWRRSWPMGWSSSQPPEVNF